MILSGRRSLVFGRATTCHFTGRTRFGRMVATACVCTTRIIGETRAKTAHRNTRTPRDHTRATSTTIRPANRFFSCDYCLRNYFYYYYNYYYGRVTRTGRALGGGHSTVQRAPGTRTRAREGSQTGYTGRDTIFRKT